MHTFAPPGLFSSLAIVTRNDADLVKGTHLRVLPSPVLGFPLAPFGVFRVTAEPHDLDASEAYWRDGRGIAVTPGDLALAGGYLIADVAPPPDDAVNVAVELLSDGPFSGSFELVDRIGFLGSERRFSGVAQAPFILGGPQVERVRIKGHGGPVKLRVWRVFANRATEEMLQNPVAVLSLPIQGTRPWYAFGRGRDDAMKRVEIDAPQRFGPPDRPDGLFDGLTPDDEMQRVSVHAPGIVDTCEQMLRDPLVRPRDQRAVTDEAALGDRPRTITDVSIESMLLMQAMDPGIARFVGLATRINTVPDPAQAPVAYATLGLFAYDPHDLCPDGRLIQSVVSDQSPHVPQIIDHFITWLDGRPPDHSDAGDLRKVLSGLRRQRLVFSGLICVAGAVPAPDRPQIVTPDLRDAKWLPGGDVPSKAFRQNFGFARLPMSALAAMARKEDGAWRTRHHDETGDLATPPRRACALLLGRTRERYQFLSHGLLSDSPVPVTTPAPLYRFSLADLFGRFGPPVDCPVPAPPRPMPPAPSLQVDVVYDDSVLGQLVDVSPGRLHITVPIPFMMDLAAGSLAIVSLELVFNGVPIGAIAVSPEPLFPDEASRTNRRMRTVTADIVLPVLGVGAQQSHVLEAQFVDTGAAKSDTGKAVIAVSDQRRPKPTLSALGLIWTSSPSSAPEVELKLRWPSEGGRRYRVYMADQKSLGIAGVTRADVAMLGGDDDRGGRLNDRTRFRLLTDPPIVGTAGTAVLGERLPRSLSTVQFVRVVPLTDAGQEASFGSCGIVAVAVPSDRAPPPPRITGRVDNETGRTRLVIEAVGLDLVEFMAAEPAAFQDPPSADARFPEFRLRRASGQLKDPVYAREIARGPLKRGSDGQFRAEFEEPSELVPFVRYSYWAEIRLPPERRVAPDRIEILPGAVEPVEERMRQDMPRRFSAISAPATVIAIPQTVQTIPVGAIATIKAADVASVITKLSMVGLPVAHPKAGFYRLRIWLKWHDETLLLVADGVNVTTPTLAWSSPPRANTLAHTEATLMVQLIDPIGRSGEPMTLTASA